MVATYSWNVCIAVLGRSDLMHLRSLYAALISLEFYALSGCCLVVDRATQVAFHTMIKISTFS